MQREQIYLSLLLMPKFSVLWPLSSITVRWQKTHRSSNYIW